MILVKKYFFNKIFLESYDILDFRLDDLIDEDDVFKKKVFIWVLGRINFLK